ncbi:MAG: AAA family ATPase [Bryobacterales bacterium]|nr:AAA family ATPase [Bryobacterales bacterium]
MLGDKRFLRTMRVRNVLSFGPESSEFELQSLNVLIGPNGSGKSNLIEAIALLQAAPGNLLEPIQTGGGINEWLWKGSESTPVAEIEATVSYAQGKVPLRHRLSLTMVGQRAELVDEAIENEQGGGADANFYYRYRRGWPILSARTSVDPLERTYKQPEPRAWPQDQSVLSQRRDPDQYPEVTYLGYLYAAFKLFREWGLGRNTQPRKPQPTDLPSDFLREDAANLALVLNDLENRGLSRSLVERLKEADETIEGFSTKVLGGTIQLFLRYSGLRSPVPATRLSDGTIRYLCLLAVLCHPSPPPLVCLEEPEAGLHPDLLPGIADLLIEASHRMQLVVTTHSDTLVDGLTSVPEAVVVCEKRGASTRMIRKTSNELSEWLKDYGLGHLWRRGHIGGNRW